MNNNTAEQEAERLYPYFDNGDAEYLSQVNATQDIRRRAHIKAAAKYSTEAIAFAQWIGENYDMTSSTQRPWQRQSMHYTTAELYQLFKAQPTPSDFGYYRHADITALNTQISELKQSCILYYTEREELKKQIERYVESEKNWEKMYADTANDANNKINELEKQIEEARAKGWDACVDAIHEAGIDVFDEDVPKLIAAREKYLNPQK